MSDRLRNVLLNLVPESMLEPLLAMEDDTLALELMNYLSMDEESRADVRDLLCDDAAVAMITGIIDAAAKEEAAKSPYDIAFDLKLHGRLELKNPDKLDPLEIKKLGLRIVDEIFLNEFDNILVERITEVMSEDEEFSKLVPDHKTPFMIHGISGIRESK